MVYPLFGRDYQPTGKWSLSMIIIQIKYFTQPKFHTFQILTVFLFQTVHVPYLKTADNDHFCYYSTAVVYNFISLDGYRQHERISLDLRECKCN